MIGRQELQLLADLAKLLSKCEPQTIENVRNLMISGNILT
jgi:hypothetical protein